MYGVFESIEAVEFVVVVTYLKTIYGGLHEVLARHRTDKSD